MHQYVTQLPKYVPPLRLAIQAINSRYRKLKIAMLHPGRCGSTVLGRMLNQHPQIFWGSEIFESSMKNEDQKPPQFAQQTIRNSEGMAVSRVYGFETKYLPFQHLCRTCINMPLEAYVESLRQLGFTKFIVLQRENYLRRAISVEVARTRNQWHTHSKTAKATKVLVDTQNYLVGGQPVPLLELFRCMDAQHKILTDNLSTNEAIFLSYEKDIQDDPTRAYQSILEFSGIPRSPAIINLKRTNPFSLNELVTNLDEIKSVLANTEYGWMLED